MRQRIPMQRSRNNPIPAGMAASAIVLGVAITNCRTFNNRSISAAYAGSPT